MKPNTINAVARRIVSHSLDNVARMGILAAFVLVFAGLLVLVPGKAMAQGKTIVILAPHPDDESLCCAGVIYDALRQGNSVKIVVVTNGDSFSSGTSFGYLRQAESVAGMALMGVGEQDIIFMGYGDQSLQSLYQSTSPASVITSASGQTQTYANRGLGGVSYHQYLYGTPGLYNRQTILGDMEAMLQNLQPSDVYTTSLWDDHPDHAGTFQFVVEALLALRRQGVPLSTRVHETFIHAPCASCGTPNSAAYLWPGGGVGIQPVFTPTVPYAEPYYLENIWPNGGNTPYSWNQIENLPVPAPMQNPVQSDNLKAQVISQYPSETDIPNGYLFSFAKRNEFFWIRDFSTNLAGLATVSVSSETPSSGQLGTSAVDGFIQGYPGYAPWEWATQGELAGAWINLSWPSPVTISQVALYNRQDLVDDVLSGTLSFSDGTAVPVGQLPINGNAFLVSFAPKTVTSMKFTVDDAVGQNIGLAEIEVYGKMAGTTANHPQIFQGPVASAAYQTDAYGQKLTPSITDAQTTNLNVVAFDVDAQPLSYVWTADAGTLTGTGPTAVFNPPIVATSTFVTATANVSNGQGGTAQNSTFITVTPSNTSGISVSSLGLNPNSIASGSTAVGTVTLTQVAPQGAVVLLSSTNPAIASAPSTVTVAPGASSASFPVSTSYVTSTTSVTISASLGGVTQNASLQVLQPPVTVSALTFSPATVGGGNSAMGTVTLSGPAVAGGAVVTLSSSSPSVATVPTSVTIPAGAMSANFTASTQSVVAPVSVTVSARYVGQTTTASLRVAPYVMPNLASLATISVSSETAATQQLGIKAIDGIVDGSPGDYTKEWASNGQLAGAWIKLTWAVPITTSQVIFYDRPNLTDNVTSGTISFSDGTTVPVGSLPNDGTPLMVSFAARTITWMQFTVNTAVGQNIGLAEVAVNGTINQASTVTGVTVAPTSVTGGLVSTGTVFLDGVAPSGGTVVTLASSDTATATVPASVTVPSGSLTATFPITTSSVTTATGVVISSTYNGTQAATLTVNPVSISALSLNPTMVAGGTASPTGTVTLTGPAPPSGAVVTLASSDASVASVPATVTLSPGATTGTFAVTTNTEVTASRVTISATFNGTQSAVLWVTPVIINNGQMQQFVIDTFNRSDGSLGTDWSTILDSPSVPQIVSQQIQSSYVYSTALFYGGINWPADQYAQAQIVQSNGGSTGPAVRMTSTGNYYAGTVGSFGNGNANVYIILDSRTNRSILASSSTATVLPNDYLQLSVQGTTLTLTNVTQSATLLTVTDPTLPAGYPGLYVGNGGSLANWSAGLTTTPSILTTNASDNFNRANAPNLGPNWAVGPGLFPIQIVNDQIESGGQGQPAGAGHGKEYYTAVPFSSDQWSQAQVVSSNNDINGALVRYQGSSDTHYVAFVSLLGPPGTCSVGIDKDTNGSPVVLATDSSNCAVAPGDVVRFQAQGPLLSYIDVTTGTLLLSTFDTQITGGSPGWSLNPVGGTPTAANWSGGQFGATAPPGVLSLLLNPNNVEGGSSAQGTVTLTNPAAAGGAVVSLTSNNPAATVPASVTVPSGSTSATFTVNTNTVAITTPVSISASYSGTGQSGTLTVSPQSVSSLILAPSSGVGGTSSTATVTLAAPAPAGGAVVTLSSSNTAAAQVPVSVTVAANAAAATFTVTTTPVAADTPVTISATYGNTQTASFTVIAPPTHSISGTISGAGGAGATVGLSGTSTATTTADSGGNYSFSGLSNGSYTVTPSNTGYVFTPASQAVTVNGADAVASFSSALQTYSLTGSISGPGGAGATVSLSGTSTATTTADSSGNYSFGGLSNGSYTVTPSNTGYVFTPASQAVTVNGADAVASFSSALQTYSLTGTISGAGGAGATVSLSGTSTATTIADSSGNYTLSGLLNGSYIVVVDNAGYVFTPASQDVVINSSNYSGLNFATVSGCPTCDTIWPAAAIPLVADSGDSTANELGVKFRADSDGYITGLRFYKAPNNTGTHIAHLWDSTGTLLGTVTVTGESVAGWQQMLFASPIPVVANTTYVASYFAPAGHYSGDANFFVNAGVDNAPLHALANGVDGANGVFLATQTGGFPSASNQSANYWVDVVYSNSQGYSIVGMITGPGAAGATVSLTGASTGTTTTDASGNYSFNGLSNGSYSVTASNSSYVFTPASQAVTINNAHVLNVTFVSALPTYSISGNISGAGGSGATVSLSGTSTATTTADSSGNYSFSGLSNGSYTVTPSNTGYVFTPASQAVTVNGADAVASFSSALQTYSLTGTISGPGGAGATVSLGGTSTATTTADGSGNYSFTGLHNGSYTVTPANTGYVFTPASQTTTINGADVSAVDFGSSITVASVGLVPASVIGGSPSTGTVTLSGPAPAGGAVVMLASSNTVAAQVPASVTVAANATTATFTVNTNPVASDTALTISATYGSTQNASFTVTAAVLSSVNLNPASVFAGGSATGTVTLTGPAPAGGAVVMLSSSNTTAAQVPVSVTVAPNATTATFAVTTGSVTSNTSLTISATYGATQNAGFTVVAVVLNSITLSPIPVLGGNSTTGTVTLSSPAPAGGAVVTLSSNKTAVAQVPSSVTVAANATTATFTVTTSPVASNTAVTISGTYNATRTVSFTVTAAVLSTIALSPTPVIGGNTTTGTVTLNGRAQAGGAVVTLSSSNTAVAQAPATVTVAANATSATFTVTTSPVTSNTSVTISGTYGANTRNVSFTVQAAVVKFVTLSPTSVLGGNSSTGTVTLSRAAPVGGAVVTLSSSNSAAAQVPASITVAANATTATFTVTTNPVATNTSPTISATYGVTSTASLTVTAAVLSTIALSPIPVVGGNTTTGTVTLTGRAPAGGAVVTLSSNKTGTAQVPASVTVPANATTATFTVTTSPMASNTSVTISATYGVTRSVSFVVQAPTMASLTLNPTTVKGGTPSTGTVTLTGAAPAGGTVVTLSSSRTAVATVPASVTVTAGNTTATFTVTTRAVAMNNSITITATRNTASTAVLLVTP